jgi:hypothetical protein
VELALRSSWDWLTSGKADGVFFANDEALGAGLEGEGPFAGIAPGEEFCEIIAPSLHLQLTRLCPRLPRQVRQG